MKKQPETVGIRLAKYKRIMRLNSTLAASLIAGVTIYAAVKFGSAVETWSTMYGANFLTWFTIFGASFLTLVIICGYFLAKSQGKIQWQADLLGWYLDSKTLKPNDPISKASKKAKDRAITRHWPTGDRLDRRLLRIFMLFCALILLLYIWFPIWFPIFHCG